MNRPINSKIGSPENLSLARTWLQTCMTSHQRCQKPLPTFTPQRVLQVYVGASLSVYRVHLWVNPAPAPYVALSYCWGGNQLYKTTKARIHAGQFDLDWHKIPKTLQDAVKVTAVLGFKYLWIDAFCIIQDDMDDFAFQMADVPSIYAYAAVTIAASRSTTAAQGFLQDINLDKDTSLAVQLPFQCPDGRLGNAYITTIAKSRNTEPIDYRAWTMQEFHLPTRLLHFGSRQSRWMCAESQMKDGFTDGWKRGYNPEDSELQPSTSYSEHEQEFKRSERSGVSPAELYTYAVSNWSSLISIYTGRRLTYTEDRP